jgi:hypothetical protein
MLVVAGSGRDDRTRGGSDQRTRCPDDRTRGPDDCAGRPDDRAGGYRRPGGDGEVDAPLEPLVG